MKIRTWLFLLSVQLIFSNYLHAQNSCFKIVSSYKKDISENTLKPHVETAKLSNYNFISCKKAECYSINKTTINGTSAYSLNDGGSSEALTKLNYPELIKNITSKAESRGRTDIYLDLSGFTKDEHSSLLASCENRLNAKRVLTNDRHVSASVLDDYFMKKEKKVLVKERGVTMIEKIGGKSFYTKTLNFVVGVKKYVLKVYSGSKKVVEDIVNLLIFKMKGLTAKPESLADVVSAIKSEIVEKHKISNDDFYIELDDEFGGSMIVYKKKLLVSSLA